MSDQLAPAVTTPGTFAVGGGTIIDNSHWNSSNTQFTIGTYLPGDNTLINGRIQIQADVDGSGTFTGLGSDSTISVIDEIHSVTIPAADLTTFGALDGNVLTFRAVVTDVAGNATIGNANYSLTVDYDPPALPVISTVIAAGGNAIPNFFNASNDAIEVTVLIEADPTLVDGEVQLMASIDGALEENVLAPAIIGAALDDITFTVPRATLEALVGFDEERILSFYALITDAAGNSTMGDESVTQLIIDETAPVANAFTELIPQGAYSNMGYWNDDNSALQITIPIDTGDPTLINGHIKIAGNIVPGDASFEIYPSELAIGSLVANQTITLQKAELETVVGFADGLTMEFQYIISDVAGNETTSATSVTTLVIDQTLPVAPDITEFTIKGLNIIPLVWNASADSLLLTIPVNTVADPTLVGGFMQVQMSVGTTFAENTYYNVLPDSFTIPTFDDTIRIGANNLEALLDWGDQNLYTRILIQDRAGNEFIGATASDVILIDTNPPTSFDVGSLTAITGRVIENAYNMTNAGLALEIPIGLDPSLENGKLILKVDVQIQPNGTPILTNFAEIDSVTITGDDLGTNMILSLTGTDVGLLDNYADGMVIHATANLLDYAGNEVELLEGPNALIVDLIAPAAPSIISMTTVGSVVDTAYWNSTNTAIELTVLTPAAEGADTSLVDGYFKVEGRIGGDPSGALGDSIPILTGNEASLVATLDSTDIEHLSPAIQGLPLDLRVTMFDGHGNSTVGQWIEDTLVIDQLAPVLGTFVNARTTTDAFITFDDSLIARWTGFSDSPSGIDVYEYAIGNTVGEDEFLNWDTLSAMTLDTLMTYTHADEYYLNVRAIDVAGNVSDIISSAAITADLNLPETVSLMDRYYFIDDWPGALNGTYADDLSGIDAVELTVQRASDELFWNGTDWDLTDTTKIDLTLTDGTWSQELLAESLTNREEYVLTLFGSDIAGNIQTNDGEPVTATLDTFQFVINTPPVFVDRPTYIDSSDEDQLYSRTFLVEDPDLVSISGDTLYYSLNALAPDGVTIDSLTGELTWLPVDSAVGLHTFPIYVEDYYGEQDSMVFEFTVIEVNDAPEPVTLLSPADSTQLVPADSLLLTFKWTSAFDIEDNPVSYEITMQGTNYDTTFPVADTTITVDVSIMDFPSTTVEWFVKALDQADTSAVADSFHVTTSAAFAALNTDSIAIDVERMTDRDTTFTLSNLGLTDLRWSLLDAPAWLTMPTGSGTIEYQDSSVIVFNVNPAAFTVGGYGGRFQVQTNDPLQPIITIQVTLEIYDTPTPVIAFFKNLAYPAFYDIMIVDSLGMIETLTVEHEGVGLEITEIDTFSYIATVEVSSEGLNNFEVIASNWVGDTTITAGVTVSLIKRGSPWLARSPDEQFEINGNSNSARENSRIAILDSMLSAHDQAPYTVLSDNLELAEAVLVSMPLESNDQAIYIKDRSGSFVEIPSMSNGERVQAWTDQMGAFKLGPRTIIVPEKSQLSQNYPNPFNPSTTIDFDIGFLDGLNQDVAFGIYNIRGQEVRNLMQTQMQPGSYSLTWNGLNDHGKQVSSGIYFARLMTGKGYVKTVKMLVLR